MAALLSGFLGIRCRRRPLAGGTSLLLVVALVVLSGSAATAVEPVAPARLHAIASPGSVRLTFVRPDDGSSVDGYRITASTGEVYAATDAPATLAPLVNGVAVSFRVAAVIGGKVGPASQPSNTVTPMPAATTNTWSPVGPMASRRVGASAVRLKSGMVLVIGGSRSGDASDGARKTAELYDPAAGAWRAAEPMDASRSGFTTTLLRDGRVLVTGGWGPRVIGRSTRLYDPATGSWSRGGRMLQPRAGHAATLLRNGTVLVTGGWTEAARITRTAEVYDPRTNRWSSTASMDVPRAYHNSTRLVGGKVLVAAGTRDFFNAGLRSSEVYNPATGRWTRAGNLSTVRTHDYWCCREAVRLASGKVLLAGGRVGGRRRGAEVFDPVTRQWTATGRLNVARDDGFAMVRLAGARVLLLGGSDEFGPLRYAELYDPATGRWTRVNDLTYARHAPLAVRLTDGSVLVAGGGSARGARRSSEIFSPG